MKALVCLIACALLASASAQEVYRWTDKNGKVHYGDQPPPEADAKAANLVKNRVSADGESFETRRAAQVAPLTLYTGADCKELCTQARDFLKKRKVPYSEQSITTPEQFAAFVRQSGQQTPQVPTLQVGTRYIEGFAPGSWGSAIDVAGYPK
jgi:glutaredoxin